MRRNAGSVARATTVVALLLAATGCDALLNDPLTPPATVRIAARFAGGPAAAASFAPVLRKADELAVTFVPLGGGDAFTENVPVSFQDGEGRARIEVGLAGGSGRFRLDLRVLNGGRPLFTALEEVELAAGEATTVEPTLDPEVGSVEITPVPAVLAPDDEVTIEARALFVTGDALEDAELTFESLDPDVLARVGDAGSNRFRAVAEGSARVQVTAEAGALEADPSANSATSEVAVEAEVASLEAEPTSLDLQVDETRTIQVTARDERGNALDRTIDFASTDPAVVTVSSAGPSTAEITGVSGGVAEIVASHGALSVRIAVSVESLPAEDEELALRLARDGAVTRIAGAVSGVAGLAAALAEVGDALEAGDVDGARAELAEVRSLVDDALATATGEERVLLVALDRVVRSMERALGG